MNQLPYNHRTMASSTHPAMTGPCMDRSADVDRGMSLLMLVIVPSKSAIQRDRFKPGQIILRDHPWRPCATVVLDPPCASGTQARRTPTEPAEPGAGRRLVPTHYRDRNPW